MLRPAPGVRPALVVLAVTVACGTAPEATAPPVVDVDLDDLSAVYEVTVLQGPLDELAIDVALPSGETETVTSPERVWTSETMPVEAGTPLAVSAEAFGASEGTILRCAITLRAGDDDEGTSHADGGFRECAVAVTAGAG